MNVALYARVSTADKQQTPETQLVALREYAARNGHEVVEEYVDWGWSGAKERRPNLDRMMADAKKQKFEMVMVARLDRFSRSVRHLIDAAQQFAALSIKFASITENIDTTTPIGQFLFVLLAALAQFERAILRERVKLGIARRKKEGKPFGRPPNAQVDGALLMRLRAEGHSLKAISRRTGLARATVKKRLKETGP